MRIGSIEQYPLECLYKDLESETKRRDSAQCDIYYYEQKMDEIQEEIDDLEGVIK